MLHNYPKLYQDPHIELPSLSLDFTDYITQCKKIVANTRQDLDQNAEKIIDINSPFELRPSHYSPDKKTPVGALLIHGLLDSPFIMKDIGTSLQSQGILIRSILLPGHGTVPGALLNTSYTQWLQAAREGIESLAKDVEQVFIVGYSTGAIAAIHQILQYDIPVAGVIAIAPALQINTKFARFTNLPDLMSGFWPRAAWMGLSEEIDYAKYSSIPYNAAYQVYSLARAVEKIHLSKKLTCPLFFISSSDDKIISNIANISFFEDNTNPENRMLDYSSQPYNQTDKRVIVRNSVYAEQNITEMSHIALPVSPNNPHYGKNGDFINASHVDTGKQFIYCDLNKPLSIYYNLLYQLNIEKKQRKRLSFNPDFDFMMQQMADFIFLKKTNHQ